MARCLSLFCLFAVLSVSLTAGETGKPRSPRESLQPFNGLIGAWKGTGVPQGGRADQQRGFWIERMDWSWQFQGDDAWLTVAFEDGRHFRSGQLRHVPATGGYEFRLKTTEGRELTFAGKLQDRTLTLSRDDGAAKERQQIVVRLLHANRFLYQYQVLPPAGGLPRRVYQVGATREGVAFAQGDGRPECVVSGGLGTMPVTYQGRTYYVCCGGCKDEFEADPAKYVREFEAKRGGK